MSVIIQVNNIWSRISGLKDIKIKDELDKITSFYVEGYQFSKAFRQGYYDRKSGEFKHWDGRKHLLSRNLIFPSGLQARIEEFFQLYGVDYQIEDKRPKIKLGESLKIKKYMPRPYQQEALEQAIKHGRGIIRVGTGGGKTMGAAMIAAHYNLPTIIYVVGKDLLYQFHNEFCEILGKKHVGIIGDGKCEIKRINICSIWTAITSFGLKNKVSLEDEDWAPEIKIKDNKIKQQIKIAVENSNVAIYDECHFLATDTLQSIYKASKKCGFHFGMSGTPWRDDGADLLLESICGKVIYNLPSSKLIENKYLVKPKIVLLESPHMDLPKNYQTVYNRYITNNEDRNFLIKDVTEKLVKKGRKVLILVRYLAHGNTIAESLNLPLYFVNGSIDGETRQQVKKDFEEGKLKVLIASSVFDIGVDIPSLDALVLAGGGKSSVRALQRIGRVIRTNPGKKNAIVVDFIDNARYLLDHSATRIAVYRTEPDFLLSFPKNFDESKLKNPRKIIKKISSK